MREHAILMILVEAKLREMIAARVGDWMLDAELHDYGIEDEPHVTVLYGLQDGDLAAARDVVKGFAPFDVTIGEIAVFEKPEYDCLKLNIDGAALRRLAREVSAAVPNQNEWLQYQPHLTLAYVLPGKGAEYVRFFKDFLKGRTMRVEQVVFGEQDGETRHVIALEGEEERLPVLEAAVVPVGEATGREWEVTIIGAEDDRSNVVTVGGETFIRSKNGRLYNTAKLAEGAAAWDGAKVYDNHLTDEEYKKRKGMRSPVKEWMGSLVQPRWDASALGLVANFRVVDDKFAAKLKRAYEQGVLKTIGLSVDTFPIVVREVTTEHGVFPVIDGFRQINSLDVVGNAAAGGRFGRILAADQSNFTESDDMKWTKEQTEMIRKMIAEEIKKAVADMSGDGKTMTEADVTATVEKVLQEALAVDESTQEADEGSPDVTTVVAEAMQEAKLATCALQLERRLTEAKLTGEHRALVFEQFDGRVFESDELTTMVERVKKMQASADTSGRVTESGTERGGGSVKMGLTADEKFDLEVQRLIMGNTQFRALEGSQNDDLIAERMTEMVVYKSWINAGKPNTGHYGKLSHLLYDKFGGDLLMDGRAMEAATTSTLSSTVKNTVNLLVAVDYAKQDRWYESIATIEEVDTIDDATLVRLYGMNTLSVVNEGGAYTELAMNDDEETAQFVKRGNYVGISLEVMLRDKINYIRSLPRRLSDSWYNTLSLLVSNVFTLNAGVGPTMSDTGALFNATAATTVGGHANLGTTALSHSAYGAGRVAMRAQTNQQQGAGRKLLIDPRYLLVPNDLETTGITIRNSERIPGSENNDINPHYQKFDVVVVPEWDDANDWALVGDPARFPSIYLIFPRGGRTPQLFSADQETVGAMFTNDEMRYKVRMLTYRKSASEDCAPVSDHRPLWKANVA